MTSINGHDVQSTAQLSQDLPIDDRLIVKWLEERPVQSQRQLAQEKLSGFLEKASQPRHASGNACIKLCYFIEQCRGSTVSPIRDVAFSEKTCLDLFNFYIEWNEKNQNRSMRQVLELLSSLILRNPQETVSKAVKTAILQKTLSIIAHQDAHPLVKPAFKSLECLLSKGTILSIELLTFYEGQGVQNSTSTIVTMKEVSETPWDSFISVIFDWMVLADVSPAAGKFLVTLFIRLRPQTGDNSGVFFDHSTHWQRWIRNGLTKVPEALENVKNYLFSPLFKLDRPGSLAFLKDLNQERSMSDLQTQEIDAHSLLQLSALDMGKKAGLVEQPSTTPLREGTIRKPAGIITLREEAIGALLINPLDTVQSLAFSVLISSSSSIRPFSPVVLDLLRSNLSILYTGTDAKFRNEILSNTKHMIERLRGATAFLVRERNQLSFKLNQSLHPDSHMKEEQVLYNDTNALLLKHEEFLRWYLEFLLGELILTSSYQRHITTLKTILLLMHSKLLADSATFLNVQTQANSTIWPFTVQFFTLRTMRLLLNLLLDPFEDVRSCAADILGSAPMSSFMHTACPDLASTFPPFDLIPNEKKREKGEDTQPEYNAKIIRSSDRSVQSLSLLSEYIGRASDLSTRTGRADYADGLAHLYKLLYGLQPSTEARLGLLEKLIGDLESKVSIAEQDLTRAVLEAPVHGNFAALTYIWDLVTPLLCPNYLSQKDSKTLKCLFDLQTRIISSCSRIWDAVKDILCNDSPEGHLPQEIDDMDLLDTKDVLSYSFRATHESSNLMRTIISTLKRDWPDQFSTPSNNTFVEVGNLTFSQLATLRHRGAFSTVSLTFATCCQLSQHTRFISQVGVGDLLGMWFKGALQSIRSQPSTTRRSAGMPALVVAIMSADSKHLTIEEVIELLKTIAQEPGLVTDIDSSNIDYSPQTHAHNTLREIFKDSRVRRRINDHQITDCLQIAANSLGSNVFAIRNCGLLLFQSVTNFLLGAESKEAAELGWDGRSKRISYEKYPSLVTLLLELLNTPPDDIEGHTMFVGRQVERIFLATDIIRRAGPPEESQGIIRASILKHLGHKEWRVREVSARTYCTLADEVWDGKLQTLMKEEIQSTNHHHGLLMAFYLVLERFGKEPSRQIAEVIAGICDHLNLFLVHNLATISAPQILTEQIKVCNTLLYIILTINVCDMSVNTHETLIRFTTQLFATHPLHEMKQLIGQYSVDSKHPNGIKPDYEPIARRALLTMDLRENYADRKEFIQMSTTLGVPAVAVELMPRQRLSGPSATQQVAWFKDAMIVFKITIDPHILFSLADMLNQIVDLQDPFINEDLQTLANLIDNSTYTSSSYLSEGIVTISGSITWFQWDAKRVENWGNVMSHWGKEQMDFDMRNAAVQALYSVYGRRDITPWIGNDFLLRSLFALYDTMNDDEESIRQRGADAVSRLIKQRLTPPAAQKEFIDWLVLNYHHSTKFANFVVQRMTGKYSRLISRIDCIRRPLLAGSTLLFSKEKQNLFIDEVKEMKCWRDVFNRITCSILEDLKPAETINYLQGLFEKTLLALTKVIEGPNNQANLLFRSEDPNAFATCTQIVVCINACFGYATRFWLDQDTNTFKDSLDPYWRTRVEELIRQVEIFLKVASENGGLQEPSLELLSPESLTVTKLNVWVPSIDNVLQFNSAGTDA